MVQGINPPMELPQAPAAMMPADGCATTEASLPAPGEGSGLPVPRHRPRCRAEAAVGRKKVKDGQNWENRTLFHCDNLDVLRGMNSGTVDLIATDPPFNKGKDFHSTNPESQAAGASFQDRWSWSKDVHEEWVDKIKDDWPKVNGVIQSARISCGDDMGAFLCFLGVRLTEMHRVLADDGSIYVHCDQTAGHYIKQLMDTVFGRANFRNEIVWHYYNKYGGGRRTFGKNFDVILFYSKAGKWKFSPQKEEREKPVRQLVRENVGGVLKNKRDPDGRLMYRMSETRKVDSVWRLPAVQPASPEYTGYPTQKPVALYERIISASSVAGDMVLDPFCGCATTLVAAERLGRRWAGVDIWKNAHRTVITRLQNEGLADPDGDTNGQLINNGQIRYETGPPERTDAGEEATPFLKTVRTVAQPAAQASSRRQMIETLRETQRAKDGKGIACAGCDRVFDDPRYFDLDHIRPRSEGGLNHIANRILLCDPCSRVKSNTLTLAGLRKENRKRGHMAPKPA